MGVRSFTCAVKNLVPGTLVPGTGTWLPGTWYQVPVSQYVVVFSVTYTHCCMHHNNLYDDTGSP